VGLVDTTSDNSNGDRIVPVIAGAAGRVRGQPMIARLVATGIVR